MFYRYKEPDFNLFFDNIDDFTQFRKAIIDTVDKLILEEIKKGNIDKYQLFTYLQEIIDNRLLKDDDRELKMAIEQYVEHLFGFEIEEKATQKRNIIILHKEKKKLAAIKIIALDLLTGTIITLINTLNSLEGEILKPSTELENIKPFDVIKMELRKVKHNRLANTYLISDCKEIKELGNIKKSEEISFGMLCDKLCRYDKYQNIFYERNDFDNKKFNLHWVTDDKNVVSSFDKVLNYNLKIDNKFIKYFIVNFTGSKIQLYRGKKYQIKMETKKVDPGSVGYGFVNVEPDIKKHLGKYYVGLALIRVDRYNEGKIKYIADSFLTKSFLNEKRKKEYDKNPYHTYSMDEEYEFDDKDWYLDEIDNIERQIEEAESIEEANELHSTLKNMQDELDSLWLDVPEEDEDYDYCDLDEKIKEELFEDLDNKLVYEISDIYDDDFALNFKTIKYGEYIKKNKLKHILKMKPQLMINDDSNDDYTKMEPENDIYDDDDDIPF